MTTDQFIEEVDADLKRERQLALWHRYGRYAVAAALLAIIVAAAFVGWRNYQENRRAEAGQAYAIAVDAAGEGKIDEALESFRRLGTDAPEGYSELARLQHAAQLARQGNEAAAAEVYDSMAKDSEVAEPFRNLALLLYGLSVVDRADPAVLADRIKSLAAATSPWRYSAQELTALLARRQGDDKSARDIFKRLADDPATPPSVRARAAEFLAVSGK
ncbi:MAG: tetratricopeptide repeat protein [Alphaproteobacteria bacterium]|nr:tetratricopeptide repeat protein [Alphaproteobacteria bacterium]